METARRRIAGMTRRNARGYIRCPSRKRQFRPSAQVWRGYCSGSAAAEACRHAKPARNCRSFLRARHRLRRSSRAAMRVAGQPRHANGYTGGYRNAARVSRSTGCRAETWQAVWCAGKHGRRKPQASRRRGGVGVRLHAMKNRAGEMIGSPAVSVTKNPQTRRHQFETKSTMRLSTTYRCRI